MQMCLFYNVLHYWRPEGYVRMQLIDVIHHTYLNNINNNNRIYIASYSRNFRGTEWKSLSG